MKKLGDERKGKESWGYMLAKRVAAGAHLPTLWLFEPAKRPDDKADYCLNMDESSRRKIDEQK